MLLTLRWGLCVWVCVCVCVAATSFCSGDCWSHTSISNQGLWREEGWWGPMRADEGEMFQSGLIAALLVIHSHTECPNAISSPCCAWEFSFLGNGTKKHVPAVLPLNIFVWPFLEICKEDQKLKAAPHFFNFVDWISYRLDSLALYDHVCMARDGCTHKTERLMYYEPALFYMLLQKNL